MIPSGDLWLAPLTRLRADLPGNVPGPHAAEYYAQRSGPEGAGVLLTEATPVCPEGHGYYRTPGLHTEAQAEAWKPVTQAVHDAGSQIFCQLWHVGRMSHVDLQPGGGAPVSSTNTAAPRHVVVGPDYKRVKCSPPRALATDDIPGVVASYRRACELAEVAGFDGVQIHGANGYLVEQFLRSGINDRTDAYGGSLENRMRFALEVTDAAISVLGAERVGFRVSPIYADVTEDRGEPDVMGTYGALADALAERNLHHLDVVESFVVGEREPELDAICARLRQAFDGEGGQRRYVAGGGMTVEDAKAAYASGRCDAVMFGRLLIANPDLGRRIREDLPLAEPDESTFYGGGSEGYTDYPRYADA